MQEIHAPCIYEQLPTDDSARALHCSLVVQVLRDAVRNCVILCDSQGVLRKQAVQSLSQWPQAHRKPVQLLLMQLEKVKRFVAVPVAIANTVAPLPGGCQLALLLAAQTSPEAFIHAAQCAACSSVGPCGVSLENYPISSFCTARDDWERVELDGEWPKQRFEAEVWRPLFRYSRRLHLVDRYIGRSILHSANDTRLNDRFEDSVAWIAGQFAQNTTRGDPSLQISCGLREDQLSLQQQRKAVGILKQFGQRLQQAFGCTTKVAVKLERRGAQSMPHARFVITDQVCLQLDPGVDVLTLRGTIKPLIISHHRDRGKVERDVHLLSNA